MKETPEPWSVTMSERERGAGPGSDSSFILHPSSFLTVPFYHHDLGKPELDAIADVLAGPLLTTGEWVRRFEEGFASYLGAKHCLGVTSCTGALHMSFEALGLGPGDEVITTAMTFIATATSAMEAGATPVLVDCERDTGLIDPKAIEAAITPRTRAIVPVHLY